MKWPLNAMLISARVFLMFLFLPPVRFSLIATTIRSTQLFACLMKHHYMRAGILGRPERKLLPNYF